MTVHELMEILREFPPDSKVEMIGDYFSEERSYSPVKEAHYDDEKDLE
jgi:hypothetical protein